MNPQTSVEDFYDLIINPDRFDDHDSENMLQIPTSEYFTTFNLNTILDSKTYLAKSSLFLLHINIRSLTKNFDTLNEHLSTPFSLI